MGVQLSDGEIKPLEYAAHYKHGGMQTADKLDIILDVLDGHGIPASTLGCLSHALKYFDRAGLKGDDGDASKDLYKCADWLHRSLTGLFLNQVDAE